MISKDDLKYIKENKGDDVGFIFYSGDVLQDVAMMNDKMKGVYLSILALHMKNISFSYDELMMLSDSLSDVEKKSLVNKLSEIDGEYFINWVLVAIFKRRKYAQNRADNRIKGHEKKLKELENISTSYDYHMENEIVIENKDIKETEIKEKPENFNFEKSLINYGFEKQLVTDWLIVRKTKRASNTQTAFNNFIIEIEKTKKDKNELLKIIVGNSWQGFNSKWILGDKPTPPPFVETRLKK